MKKLNKLNFNPEKVMKDEELVILRGGYGPGGGQCCWCVERITMDIKGAMVASNPTECEDFCSAVPGWFGWWNSSEPNCQI